jgi:predicted acylesterase/phospholipase RssA
MKLLSRSVKIQRICWFLVVMMAGLIGVACVIVLSGYISRNYTRLGRYYEPVGHSLKGDIDLNNPVPFAKLQLGTTIVGLSCSGGGSRAAYFTAAVLNEIHRRRLSLGLDNSADTKTDLLSQIDVVSSVSGGSLAAAYFVANVAKLKSADADSIEWIQYLDKMATRYRQREWYQSILYHPTVLFKLLFTNYNRGLMARDDYDETLFHGATIADLPDQPALYINSFDVANHTRFVFSKSYIDTWFYQPKDAWGNLRAPQDFTSENDLGFLRIDPSSVSIADAVYASSAFPVVYPNLALNHYGSKILFQGGQVFLADGGLVDNSGLLTLLTQIKANMDDQTKNRRLLVIYIDASLDNINTDGTSFQQQGIEDEYAWRNTLIGQGIQSIDSANAEVQDLVWKFVESLGVVTEQDRQSPSWPMTLVAKPQAVYGNSKASWDGAVASGQLALRPYIIRLGLRDIAYPNFQKKFLNDKDARLHKLLAENGLKELGPYDPAPGLPERLQRIKTDFVMSDADRHALDLAAYLLVNGKLARDLQEWSGVRNTIAWQNGKLSE